MKKTVIELAKRLLPHFVIVLSVVFMVFLVLNSFNPTMAFLSNHYSSTLLWIFCALSISESVFFVIRNRRGQ